MWLLIPRAFPSIEPLNHHVLKQFLVCPCNSGVQNFEKWLTLLIRPLEKMVINRSSSRGEWTLRMKFTQSFHFINKILSKILTHPPAGYLLHNNQLTEQKEKTLGIKGNDPRKWSSSRDRKKKHNRYLAWHKSPATLARVWVPFSPVFPLALCSILRQKKGILSSWDHEETINHYPNNYLDVGWTGFIDAY